MSIPLASKVVPAGNSFGVADVININGATMPMADNAARDAIPAGKRLEGMRVRVLSTGLEYLLASDLTTWNLATKPVAVTAFTANANNLALAAGELFHLSSDAARDLTGIVAGVGGQQIVLVNTGSFAITLKHQSASSTAANRFLNSTGADIVLSPNETVAGYYDATTGRYRLFGAAASSLPTPGSDGNVLTVVSGAWASAAAPSGSGDALSALSLPEIVITNASTSLTPGRWHVLKATTGPQVNALPSVTGSKRKWLGIRIDPDSTQLVTIEKEDGNIGPGTAGTRIMHAGESAFLVCNEAETEWTKTHGETVPFYAVMIASAPQSIPNGTLPPTKFTNFDGAFDNCNNLMVDTTGQLVNILRSGIYEITYKSLFLNLAGAGRLQLTVGKNGTTDNVDTFETYGAQAAYPRPAGYAPIVGLTAGDTIIMGSYQLTLSAEDAYPTLTIVEKKGW